MTDFTHSVYDRVNVEWLKEEVELHNGFFNQDELVSVFAFQINKSDFERGIRKILDNGDTWLIFIAQGDLRHGFTVLPKKEYIAWERNGRNGRLVTTEKFRGILGV